METGVAPEHPELARPRGAGGGEADTGALFQSLGLWFSAGEARGPAQAPTTGWVPTPLPNKALGA